MTREELALETEHLDLLEANTKAKDAYRANPNDKTKAAKNTASLALWEFRTKWREVRDAFAPTPDAADGVARPKIVNGKAK